LSLGETAHKLARGNVKFYISLISSNIAGCGGWTNSPSKTDVGTTEDEFGHTNLRANPDTEKEGHESPIEVSGKHYRTKRADSGRKEEGAIDSLNWSGRFVSFRKELRSAPLKGV